jgi:hypothetical protein
VSGSLLSVGQSVIPRFPGFPVLTYSEILGWLILPDDAWAHAISVARHGFVLFAGPSFTATMPNAPPDGSVFPHCGYETSYPVGVAPFWAACAAAPDALTIAKDATTASAAMLYLTDQPLPLPPAGPTCS